MSNELKKQAEDMIAVLCALPEVKGCTVYGSLSSNTADELSDIDINVDVSGSDNGQFMLGLAERLSKKLKICYFDYAPSLIPQCYIVSVAIDEHNPFRIVDLQCSAENHCTTVTKQQAARLNRPFTHILKLWTANLKHYARGAACSEDIVHMARKLALKTDRKDEPALLGEVLDWLEGNATDELRTMIASCREYFEKLTGAKP